MFTVRLIYTAVAKVIVLKMVYGALLVYMAKKAWFIYHWFLKYLAHKVEPHHIEHEEIWDAGEQYHPHSGFYDKVYDGKHKYENVYSNDHDNVPYEKPMYDADGSYSIPS